MDTNNVTIDIKQARKRRTKEVIRRFKKNKLAMIGLVIITIMILMAVFADVIADYDEGAIRQHSDQRLLSPSKEHPFGTDTYGRDQLARVVHGARVSLSLGVFTTVISLGIGGLLGAMCGYYSGLFDEIVMRLMDILLSIPTLLMAIAIVSALGPTVMNLLIAITISQIPVFTRVVRSSVLSVAGEDYIEAAKIGGARVCTSYCTMCCQRHRAHHSPGHHGHRLHDPPGRRHELHRPWRAAPSARVGQYAQPGARQHDDPPLSGHHPRHMHRHLRVFHQPRRRRAQRRPRPQAEELRAVL